MPCLRNESLRFVIVIMLSIAGVLASAGAGPEIGSNGSTVFDMIQLVLKSNGIRYFFPNSDKTNPQTISVVGAGHGRTGTSSLRSALNRLGLKTYHMEGVLQTPGHVDLWHSYYHLKTITIDDVLDRIEADGFNATLDGPTNFFFQRQFERNPHVKVILTLRRGGADSWVKSMYESVLLFHPLLRRAPFRWIPRIKKQSQFFAAMNNDLGVPVEGPENMPVREYMAAAYDNWTNHVQSTIPADRLLVFYAQDGWEPLCRFLSPLAKEIEANCEAVLTSGEAYPHVNDTIFIQRLVAGLSVMCSIVEWTPFLLILLLIRVLLKRYSRRTRSSIKGKTKRM
jgi:Sulfotransferase domain